MIDRSLNYGRHHILNFLRSAGPAMRVVDLGAGGGADLALAKQAHPNASLVAVESYGPYVEGLRSRGIEVVPLDIERDKLPFDDATVDIFIVNQILEHCKEVFWIFSEMSRCLKLGGCIIIGVPNLAAFHNRILLAIGRQPSQIKTASAHVRGYTKPDIEGFLSSCFPGGYAREGFGGGNFYPFPPILAKPMAAMLPSMAWGIFMLYRKMRDYQNEFLLFPQAQQLETNFWLGERQAT